MNAPSSCSMKSPCGHCCMIPQPSKLPPIRTPLRVQSHLRRLHVAGLPGLDPFPVRPQRRTGSQLPFWCRQGSSGRTSLNSSLAPSLGSTRVVATGGARRQGVGDGCGGVPPRHGAQGGTAQPAAGVWRELPVHAGRRRQGGVRAAARRAPPAAAPAGGLRNGRDAVSPRESWAVPAEPELCRQRLG